MKPQNKRLHKNMRALNKYSLEGRYKSVQRLLSIMRASKLVEFEGKLNQSKPDLIELGHQVAKDYFEHYYKERDEIKQYLESKIKSCIASRDAKALEELTEELLQAFLDNGYEDEGEARKMVDYIIDLYHTGNGTFAWEKYLKTVYIAK